MSDHERSEKLYNISLTGDRTSTEMMETMLEMCSRREESTNLFVCLFMQRLHMKTRVMLSRVDHKNPKAMAEEAGFLWTRTDGPRDPWTR
jgi:hypothetical protein